MVRVEITPEAQSQFLDVPHGMQDRILAVFRPWLPGQMCPVPSRCAAS